MAEWFHVWRYFFLFLAVLLLVAGFYAEESWRGSWAWSRHRRKMEARGERMNYTNFIPPLVPHEKNFARTPLLAPLFAISPSSGIVPRTKLPAIAESLTSEFISVSRVAGARPGPRVNTWVRPPASLAVWQAVLLKATNQTVLPRERLVTTNFTVTEAARAVQAALSDCEPVFAELQAASHRPHSRFDIFYEQEDPASILLPHLAPLKQLSHLVSLRISTELALGQADAAFTNLNVLLCLADATRDEPILISHLIRAETFSLVTESIANGISHWSAPQLRALQESLDRVNFCADGRRVLQSECYFFGDRIIEYVRRSENKPRLLSTMGGWGHSLAGPEYAAVLMTIAPDGWFDLERLNYSRMFQEHLLPIIDATNRLIRPSATRHAGSRQESLATHSAAGLFIRHQFFCGLLLPDVSTTAQKLAFAQTAADTASLACALDRYRRTHGFFPEAPASLVPEFTPRLPHDVINGQPLKYRRTKDGLYLLYSVGWNETDDGGRLALNKSGEAVDREQGDWVWQPCP